jgi:hypothetical protein
VVTIEIPKAALLRQMPRFLQALLAIAVAE